MTESTRAGLAVAAGMLDEKTLSLLEDACTSDSFGAKLADLSLDFVFGKVWCRPGLGLRERSLVTLGILIALRQNEELKIHALAAVRNGCTVQDIEEVLYQATAYAGFPAASAAASGIGATLRHHGLIK